MVGKLVKRSADSCELWLNPEDGNVNDDASLPVFSFFDDIKDEWKEFAKDDERHGQAVHRVQSFLYQSPGSDTWIKVDDIISEEKKKSKDGGVGNKDFSNIGVGLGGGGSGEPPTPPPQSHFSNAHRHIYVFNSRCHEAMSHIEIRHSGVAHTNEFSVCDTPFVLLRAYVPGLIYMCMAISFICVCQNSFIYVGQIGLYV